MNPSSDPVFAPRALGRTRLVVGPLGLSSSYRAPAAAVERAFEHGMNYLYWGSLRREAFGEAIRNLAPRRERFVLVLQSYSPFGFGITRAVERGLRSLSLDFADVLLLGYWNRVVPERIRDTVRELKAVARGPLSADEMAWMRRVGRAIYEKRR